MKKGVCLLLCLLFSASVWAKKDSSYHAFTYYRIGMDLTKPTASFFQDGHRSLEFQVDVNYRKAVNLVLEAGTGSSEVSNEFISYKSQTRFARFGIDHPFFNEEFRGDKDNAFIGLRYALGMVNRKDAIYTINDPIWGLREGIYPANRFLAHWIELTGGFRMELKRNLFLGWNMRMKSIVNPNKFETLPPSYMAGYGRGDKNNNVDFNLYLLYGFGKR